MCVSGSDRILDCLGKKPWVDSMEVCLQVRRSGAMRLGFAPDIAQGDIRRRLAMTEIKLRPDRISTINDTSREQSMIRRRTTFVLANAVGDAIGSH